MAMAARGMAMMTTATMLAMMMKATATDGDADGAHWF